VSVHVILITAAKPGRFDAKLVGGGDVFLVESTRTPFLDSARALLAGGLAAPSDVLIMRHDGSEHDALRAAVGVAAKLTVNEDGPRFVRHAPERLAGLRKGPQTPKPSPPMRRDEDEAPRQPPAFGRTSERPARMPAGVADG
jgi:hypothetical protein